ncbi:nucleotidyl transferase AbiEii/AbiGii toxin family protein [Candidatus Peregrinibacteria bacterium]|nr:nucleotidyl transferase AbiEii/AbiGii toxin family protein [Candidatus Peregrinibacteria bacterium]
MEKTILGKQQKQLLELLSEKEIITNNFHLTGGTALAEFYLYHRYSEDLDFFSETEFDVQVILSTLKTIRKEGGIKKIDYQQSFNRNLIFLHCKDEIIKTEFTFFPFTKIEKGPHIGKLQIESLHDIAVNKIFTIYQKPRSRDFIDLFLILKKHKWTIPELITKARTKFDWHVDYLQLGSQFLLAKKVKDYPRMIIKIKDEEWQNFFEKEAEKLGKKILN